MRATTTSGKILHNSFWYGVETVLELVAAFGTSIAIARCLGPEKLGHYAAVSFPILAINALSGSGLSMATRKYMAEFLGHGDSATARAVFNFNQRYQLIGAVFLTLAGLGIVLRVVAPAYRLMAVLLVLSVVPGMMANVFAQANLAFEDASDNAKSAVGYVLTNAFVVALSLLLHWDLAGIAAAMLAGRLIEVLLRGLPLRRRMYTFPLVPLSSDLKRRIRRFCFQAMAIQVLSSIVWDRSELFLLAAFCGAKEVAYYSVSAGLVGYLLMLPRVLAFATGVSVMAESSRKPDTIGPIVFNAVRLICVLALPVYIGTAAISKQIIWTAYGASYAPAVPVMIIALLFGVIRCFQDLPQVIMRAADRQSTLIRSMVLTAIVNLALDFAFIPRYGAIGAAIGNGVAQAFGVFLFWKAATNIYPLHIPTRAILRIATSSAVAALAAFGVARNFRPVLGLTAGIMVAVPVFVFMLRILRALESSDYVRLNLITKRLPVAVRWLAERALQFAVPQYIAGEAIPEAEAPARRAG